jgi:hypothetical protein
MTSPPATIDTPIIASRLLDNYSKTAMPRTTPSEGTSFVQRGGKGRGAGKGKGKPFNKERWMDKECHNCKKKGHPAWACPDDDDDDDKSRSSQAQSVKRLEKDLKSIKKAFTQLQQAKEADSDTSDLEASESDLHFQFEEVGGFQFAQVETEFEPHRKAVQAGVDEHH